MALFAAALAVVLAAQSAALVLRLPGLHLFPRDSPRTLALLPGLVAVAAAALAWWAGGLGFAVAGALLGAVAALVLPTLRPLHPDAALLAGGPQLEIAGHPDAKAVVLRPAGQVRATVLVCHGGGNDRTFALWHAVPRLVARGFAVVLFHLPGHGRGGADLLDLDGFRARFDAVREAAERVSQVHGRTRTDTDEHGLGSPGGSPGGTAGGSPSGSPGVPSSVAVREGPCPSVPLVALGQSLGGALVLDALCRGVRLDGAVTVSAITRLQLGWRVARELLMVLHGPAWNALRHDSVLRLLPLPGSRNRERYPVRVGDPRGHLAVFEQILGAFDLERRLAAAAVPCPLLLVQGAEDAIVPVEQGRALATALGDRAVYWELPGRRHLDPLFDEALVDRICGFLDERVTGLR